MEKSSFKGLSERMIAALYTLEPNGNREKVVDMLECVRVDPEGILFSCEGKCILFLNPGVLQSPSFLPKLHPTSIFFA